MPPKGAIPVVIGNMGAKDDDLTVVKALFDNPTLDIEPWLNSLNIVELEGLKAECVKYATNGASDNAIRGFSKYLPSISNIKVVNVY